MSVFYVSSGQVRRKISAASPVGAAVAAFRAATEENGSVGLSTLTCVSEIGFVDDAIATDDPRHDYDLIMSTRDVLSYLESGDTPEEGVRP